MVWFIYVCVCVCVCVYIYIYIYIYIYNAFSFSLKLFAFRKRGYETITFTYTHTKYIHTYIHTCSSAWHLSSTRTLCPTLSSSFYIHTHTTHTCIHTYIHAYPRAARHGICLQHVHHALHCLRHFYTHTHTQYIHTHKILTYIHTHNTNIHTHTHVQLGMAFVFNTYIMPYIVFVMWLDAVTYLHHTDRELPWYVGMSFYTYVCMYVRVVCSLFGCMPSRSDLRRTYIHIYTCTTNTHTCIHTYMHTQVP